MIQARYRRDYDGEFVVVESRWSSAVKNEQREWIPNAVENHHISGRAAVIGSPSDAAMFDYRILQRHNGGLLARKKLQTYGCGQLWKDMRFDFFVSYDKNTLDKIQDAGYHNDTVVFTDAKNCVQHPGSFYLNPYQPAIDQVAMALYLAAFDGHEEIFILGCNKDTEYSSISWQEHVNEVIQAYSSTSFVLVGVPSNMPDTWRRNQNVRCMKYREFISYCDV